MLKDILRLFLCRRSIFVHNAICKVDDFKKGAVFVGKVKLPNNICKELNALGLSVLASNFLESDLLVSALQNVVIRKWANIEDNLSILV
jgi:hypothetical protein